MHGSHGMLWQVRDGGGKVELEIQRRRQISTNIWKMKQNRNLWLIGHGENLAKDDACVWPGKAKRYHGEREPWGQCRLGRAGCQSSFL